MQRDGNSRGNGGGDLGVGREVSGRQRRSPVPYPLPRGSSSRGNGGGEREPVREVSGRDQLVSFFWRWRRPLV